MQIVIVAIKVGVPSRQYNLLHQCPYQTLYYVRSPVCKINNNRQNHNDAPSTMQLWHTGTAPGAILITSTKQDRVDNDPLLVMPSKRFK